MRTLKPITLITFLFLAVNANANNVKENIPAPESIFNHLSYKEVLDIKIKTDLTALIENKKSEAYQQANLSYIDQNGVEKNRPIELKARGKFRRMRCTLPPLKIKFSKYDLAKDGLTAFNKLKLVTHCDEESTASQTLLKEYQAYKLFNELSDSSFRVQLLRITYIDTDGSSFTNFGFFIESVKELADRIGGVEDETLNVQSEELNTYQKDLVATFQFMIGNSDWLVRRLKNVKLIRPASGGKLIPIPYDFDFSGLVDAYYAVPSSDYPIKSVTDRIFLGNSNDDLKPILRKLKGKKSQLLASCTSLDYLEKENRKAMIRYINSFYRIINQQDKWLSI